MQGLSGIAIGMLWTDVISVWMHVITIWWLLGGLGQNDLSSLPVIFMWLDGWITKINPGKYWWVSTISLLFCIAGLEQGREQKIAVAEYLLSCSCYSVHDMQYYSLNACHTRTWSSHLGLTQWFLILQKICAALVRTRSITFSHLKLNADVPWCIQKIKRELE